MRKIILHVLHTVLILLFFIANYSCTKEVMEIQQPFVPNDNRPPIFTPSIISPPIDTTIKGTPPLVTPPIVNPPVVIPPVVAPPVVTPPVVFPPVVTPPIIIPPVQGATSITVGVGSGYLTIDGRYLDLTKLKLINIKAGTYKGIYIKNIIATASSPIAVKNSGQVIITEGMETDNVNYINISGDGEPAITYGFLFQNISYRAIKMGGKMTGVILNKLSFKNVRDYCIAGERNNGPEFTYRGTAETRTDNFKILNCVFENTGRIIFGGSLSKDSGEDSGFYKNVEIAYNIFKNSPDVGSVCTFSNVQDFDIHHNIVDNINQNNDDHNGIFYMQGNGDFHDNKLTNYQGNSIRMWLYSRGSTPATNEIYNNICYNTRKYSGFELQGFDRYIIAGKTTVANAKVYNNTIGQMNTSKDWEGQLLDLYNYGGTLAYYNNLGFGLNRGGGGSVTNMINNMSDTKIIKETNNKYMANQSAAVQNTSNFTSLFSGIGAPAK